MDRLPFPARRRLAPALLAAACGLFAAACVSPGGGTGYGGSGGYTSSSGTGGFGGFGAGTTTTTTGTGTGASGGSGTSSSSNSSTTGGPGPDGVGNVPEFGPCQCDDYDVVNPCDSRPLDVTCGVAQDSCNNGLCRPSCMMDSDCSAGSACSGGSCTLSCTPGASPDGCPSGTACSNVGPPSTASRATPCRPRRGASRTATAPRGRPARETRRRDGACDPWCRVGAGRRLHGRDDLRRLRQAARGRGRDVRRVAAPRAIPRRPAPAAAGARSRRPAACPSPTACLPAPGRPWPPAPSRPTVHRGDVCRATAPTRGAASPTARCPGALARRAPPARRCRMDRR